MEHGKDHSSDMLDLDRPGQHEEGKEGDNSTSPPRSEPATDPLDLSSIIALKDAPSDLGDTPPLDPIELSDIIEVITSDISDLVLVPLKIDMISQPQLKPPQIIDFSVIGDRVVAEVELVLNYRSADLQEVQTPKQVSPPSPDPESPASQPSDDERSPRPPYLPDLATVVIDNNSLEIFLRRQMNARLIDFYESSISYFSNYGSTKVLLLEQEDLSCVPNARKRKKKKRQRRKTIHKGKHYNNAPVIRTLASRNKRHRDLPQPDDLATDQLAGSSTSRAMSTNPSNTTAPRRTKAPNYRESPIYFSSDYSYKRYLPLQEDPTCVIPSLSRKKREVGKRRVMQTGTFYDSLSRRTHVSQKKTSKPRVDEEPLRKKEDIVYVKKDNLQTGENSKNTSAPPAKRRVIEEGTNRRNKLYQAIGQCIGSASPESGDDYVDLLDEASDSETSTPNTRSPQLSTLLHYIPPPEY